MKKKIEMAIESVTEKEFETAIENDSCAFGNKIADVLKTYIFRTQIEEDEFIESLFLETSEDTVEETRENLLSNLDDLEIN